MTGALAPFSYLVFQSKARKVPLEWVLRKAPTMRALRLENSLLTTNALAYFTRKSVTMEKNGKAIDICGQSF
jgi:hypothetical protein